MIEQEKISEIVNKIISVYNPDRIILFGSYANGTANENSDLDLFVIKNSDLPRPQRSIQIRKLLFGLMIPIDLIVYTPKELEDLKKNKYGFVYQVLKTGKILYERSN